MEFEQLLVVINDENDARARAMAHASRLAQAVRLDMSAQWTPTKENYLGRVTKARTLQAVREAKGEASAQPIDHLKKGDMADEAERLLADTSWLPAFLRTPGLEGHREQGAGAEISGPEVDAGELDADTDPDDVDLPAFLVEGGAAPVEAEHVYPAKAE